MRVWRAFCESSFNADMLVIAGFDPCSFPQDRMNSANASEPLHLFTKSCIGGVIQQVIQEARNQDSPSIGRFSEARGQYYRFAEKIVYLTNHLSSVHPQQDGYSVFRMIDIVAAKVGLGRDSTFKGPDARWKMRA
jgi:hypothetical protein